MLNHYILIYTLLALVLYFQYKKRDFDEFVAPYEKHFRITTYNDLSTIYNKSYTYIIDILMIRDLNFLLCQNSKLIRLCCQNISDWVTSNCCSVFTVSKLISRRVGSSRPPTWACRRCRRCLPQINTHLSLILH